MSPTIRPTALGCPYLSPEIHLMISRFLKDDGRLDTLAVLSRSSNWLRSIYEPQLYRTAKHENYPHCYPNEALMWGITNESVPVMAQAKAYGADINARVKGCYGKEIYYHTWLGYGLGTMLQHAVQKGRGPSVVWLVQEGAVINTPDQAAVNMCECDATIGEPEHKCSTLHLALCKGHFLIALFIIEQFGPAALEESKNIDRPLILRTAIKKAFYREDIEFLSAMLEYPSVCNLVNMVNPHDGQTVLDVTLSDVNMCLDSRGQEFLDSILETLVHEGGASLGPYPAESRSAGQSPLVTVLEHGGYETAQQLLHLGCDTQGLPPTQETQNWSSPLHCLIRPASDYIGEDPEWMDNVENRRYEYPTRSVQEIIETLVRSGASLMIKATQFNSTPLENAISHGAPFLSLSRRVAAYKLLKVLLKHVKEGKITQAAREQAEKCMEQIKEDLRAEHALYDLSDERVKVRSWWDEEHAYDQPILLS
ncbi:hypothetical protein QBC32DRAFT_355507 [Pseudoneurospora amorphoporcata]|uniref:Uncharacterized protein n=1 Tax=Pseudoneurospora amorphoporcata TaxID=241081 RepID=A0AAN6SBQ5_9PEZI|nr:hypothetical protein QBC32DRAFT_355507 [Pseudoneurospora amorphoporcata]